MHAGRKLWRRLAALHYLAAHFTVSFKSSSSVIRLRVCVLRGCVDVYQETSENLTAFHHVLLPYRFSRSFFTPASCDPLGPENFLSSINTPSGVGQISFASIFARLIPQAPCHC